MNQISLDKSSFLKIILRNIYYSFFNICLSFLNIKVKLRYNSKIKIKVKSIIDYKFIFQKNQKVELLNSTFVYEYEETNKIISHSNKNNLFIDLGSHHGYFSFIACEYFKKVYSVELSKKFYENQLRIKKYNNIGNLKIFNCAIGDGNILKYSDYLSNTKIKSITLSNFLLQNTSLKENIFLKIDINGFEKSCLDDLNRNQINNIEKILIDIYFDKIFSRNDLKNSFSILMSKYNSIDALFHEKNKSNIFVNINPCDLESIFHDTRHKIVSFLLYN